VLPAPLRAIVVGARSGGTDSQPPNAPLPRPRRQIPEQITARAPGCAMRRWADATIKNLARRDAER